ncbi:DUF951 family protein [Mesoplasma corruscae]|uniref:DUF951 domain-containing protein n=1 Tax=Mesoplasma corruscae TaxID=216874 RepID=A0A2S5RHB9_9MOLU|nr:hypothetical protein MCORR_v1c03190 [Mesoplasma corruscae]
MHKDLEIGDYVILKKSHPSKTTKWKLIKIGANYKFQSFEIYNLFIELDRPTMDKTIKYIEKKEN